MEGGNAILNWAKQREQALFNGVTEAVNAKTALEKSIQAMNRAAEEMENQSEADIASSFKMDLENILTDLEKRITEWRSTHKAVNELVDGIEKGEIDVK